MDAVTLAKLVKIIPADAVEVVVKGRTDEEIFFSMPREWKPDAAVNGRISRAPNQPMYKTYKTHHRWRAR